MLLDEESEEPAGPWVESFWVKKHALTIHTSIHSPVHIRGALRAGSANHRSGYVLPSLDILFLSHRKLKSAVTTEIPRLEHSVARLKDSNQQIQSHVESLTEPDDAEEAQEMKEVIQENEETMQVLRYLTFVSQLVD
jgi:hypothetical protein